MRTAHAPQPGATGAERSRESNNFDLLRLLAATCVVFSHSFDLLLKPQPFVHVETVQWGFVGILVFFSISGYLVCQSWTRNASLLPFAIKRALRLIPGLFITVLLSALILGSLATTAPVHAYLQDPGTKSYVLNNVLMQTNYVLPGVFSHNVYPGAVNGSLWTLPLEVKCYVFIAIAGLLGLFSRRRVLMPVLALLSVLACIEALRRAIPVSNHLVALLADIQMSPDVVHRIREGLLQPYPDMAAIFVLGAALYTHRKWIPLRWDVAGVAAAALVICGFIGGQAPELGAVVLGPYLVLCLAMLSADRIHMPERMGDYSYGLYLYAFPVQQTISQVLTPTSGWVMFLVAMPITLALAVGSWHLVERPSLSLKRRLTGALPPAGTPPSGPAHPELLAADG